MKNAIGVSLRALLFACGATVEEPSSDERVRLVLVEAGLALHADVRAELDRMSRIGAELGITLRELPVDADVSDANAHSAVRLTIRGAFEDGGLEGVLLVGSVPTAFYQTPEPAGTVSRRSTDWVYRAPYAEWRDGDGDGVYESIGGDLRALVPVARVFSGDSSIPGAPDRGSRVALGLSRLNDDDEGVRPVWSGALDFLDSPWGFGGVPGTPSGVDTYVDYALTIDPACGKDTTTSDGFWDIAARGYEFLNVCVHGSGNQMTFRDRDADTCEEIRAGGSIQTRDFWSSDRAVASRFVAFNSCSVCGIAQWLRDESAPSLAPDPVCGDALNASEGTIGLLSASASVAYQGLPTVTALVRQGVGLPLAMNANWNRLVRAGDFPAGSTNLALVAFNSIGSPYATTLAPPTPSGFVPHGGYTSERGVTDTADLGLLAGHGISPTGDKGTVLFWARDDLLDAAVAAFDVELTYTVAAPVGDRTIRSEISSRDLGRDGSTWSAYYSYDPLGAEIENSFSFRVRPRFSDGNTGGWSRFCTARGHEGGRCGE